MNSKSIFLLDKCWEIIKAIDDCTDCFLLYIEEKDLSMKKLFAAIHEKKCRELHSIVNEAYEKL